MTVKEPTYLQIASQKRAERDQNFKKEWLIPKSELPDLTDVSDWITSSGYLSAKEIEITESNAGEIVENISNQVWSSFEVTLAFCHRASIVHQLTNCLSEVFFDEGLKQAMELDEYQKATGKTLGPLHGLPISIKDNFNIKGQASTVGIVNFSFNPKKKFEEDAVLVKMLRELGGVFYVKTNVPVAMMMPETTNHIYGNTTNPLNRNLSAGGSSGGEVALLACKGSPTGVGTDIGGSLRIPASFTNVYTLKPTFGRFPTYGARSGLPGLESVNSVNGPLCPSLETMEFYCKHLIGHEPWLYDAKVNEIPWRKVELDSKLNIAILEDDKVVRPTPPILRGVNIVKEGLLKAGHEVIEWEPTDHLELSKIITSFFTSDGGIHVKRETKTTGEPFFPYMRMYGTTPEMKVSELWALQARRTSLIKDYLERWNATKLKTKNGKPIDAIIMPATPFAGSPNSKFHDYVGYTSPFNLLDYTVGVFPVTRADQDIDLKEARGLFYGETDEKIWGDYNPQETHGGAVSLQLIGRKYQEEKVIEMMKLVRDLIS